tara:strand:+ start:5658 stop:5771 length:114 start_codon:yes stop_codon:yes gene_type:complete
MEMKWGMELLIIREEFCLEKEQEQHRKIITVWVLDSP